MFTNLCSVAEVITNQLSPAVVETDRESATARAGRAQDEANSLRRILGNLLRRSFGMQPILTQEQQLARAIRQLSQISPHLLADIGLTHTVELDGDLPLAQLHPAPEPSADQTVRSARRPRQAPSLPALPTLAQSAVG